MRTRVLRTSRAGGAENRRRNLVSSCLGLSATAAIAISAVGMSGTAVDARIKCQGAYQVTGGNLVATPYCEDQYLARVGRSYGARFSARQIRQSVSAKEELCRLVGYDSRVQAICKEYLPDGQDRRTQ